MNGKRQKLDDLFIETIEQNKTAMFRLAYSIVLNREDAEDVVSESILKAFSNLSELKNSRKMKAWLFQIIANESKTCLRKRKRVELTEVILLYYFETFRVKEIAKILAVSEGTVKSRLSRARQELKKALEDAQ